MKHNFLGFSAKLLSQRTQFELLVSFKRWYRVKLTGPQELGAGWGHFVTLLQAPHLGGQ